MEIILVIFIIIVFFLSSYLFLMKKELRRIKKELNFVLSKKTNSLIHTEFMVQEIQDLVECINTHLTNIKHNESKLERKNANFIKMIRNISHDLRTPLTSSLGYVSLMLESNMSEQEKIKNLKIVEERLKRLSELIDSFFEFSKILSNPHKIPMSEINLIGILETSISHHYEDFSKNHRKINFYTKQRNLYIKTNEPMLMRTFDNLIHNAYKHSNEDLEITVKATNKIFITFSNVLLDTNFDVHQIFDEFYTVDISRTKGNTGLGLAIVKEFVSQLGGSIQATKEKRTLKIVLTFPKKIGK